MAKAVAARIYGDDYQARYFWLQVCRMFEDRSKVAKVEIESNNVKSLDDVIVHYAGLYDFGQPIGADFYQVKFHVTASGAITWEGLMDPNFINAASVSILQRLRDAQQRFAPKGTECRFNIFSPWTVHPDDELAEMQDLTEGRIRWDVLSSGGDKSRMGRIRSAWRSHLGLSADDELRVVLAPIRLKQGPMLDDLSRTLNLHLRLSGLRPIDEGAILNQYDDLARKLIQAGRTSFTGKDIEGICRQAGLWVGRTCDQPDAVRLGIRSFWRFAESLEDETDATLCLLRHFSGRAPKDTALWRTDIVQEVRQFLRKCTTPGRSHLLRLQTHGTIAFLAGWEMNPKSGVDIAPVQDGVSGRQTWKPENVSPESAKEYSSWQITASPIRQSAGPDIVVAISATHDIEKDVLIYAEKVLKEAGLLLHFRLAEFGPAAIRGGTHAQLLAEAVIATVRKHRQDPTWRGTLHVFFAAPNGLVFLLGRMAHGLGKLHLHEFDFEANIPGAYRPSIELPLPEGQFQKEVPK